MEKEEDVRFKHIQEVYTYFSSHSIQEIINSSIEVKARIKTSLLQSSFARVDVAIFVNPSIFPFLCVKANLLINSSNYINIIKNLYLEERQHALMYIKTLVDRGRFWRPNNHINLENLLEHKKILQCQILADLEMKNIKVEEEKIEPNLNFLEVFDELIKNSRDNYIPSRMKQIKQSNLF